jgi:hypothetical protein
MCTGSAISSSVLCASHEQGSGSVEDGPTCYNNGEGKTTIGPQGNDTVVSREFPMSLMVPHLEEEESTAVDQIELIERNSSPRLVPRPRGARSSHASCLSGGYDAAPYTGEETPTHHFDPDEMPPSALEGFYESQHDLAF